MTTRLLANTASRGSRPLRVGPGCSRSLRPQCRTRDYATNAEATDSFLRRDAADYVDDMHLSWKKDPQSVHSSWRSYFRNIEDNPSNLKHAFQPPPGFLTSRLRPREPEGNQQSELYSKVQSMVQAYQKYGHRVAKVDPLDGESNSSMAAIELSPAFHGLTSAHLNLSFPLGDKLLPELLTVERKSMTVQQLIDVLDAVYCGTMSIEYMHISNHSKRAWLQSRFEQRKPEALSKEDKKVILETLARASSFERILATKFPTEKRFGLDGAESLAPAISTILNRSAEMHGVNDVTIGSCHRGKLTMLATVYGKPAEAIMAEFQGSETFKLLPGMTGDMKYHLGHAGEISTPGGHKISLSLLPNPSHLEAIDPIATGKAFARQHQLGSDKAMCLALHGDAAFSGQGVVYETLGLAELESYNVNGTIRVLVNNQIGFTTDSTASRSTPYCTDIAKYIEAPIIHVNGHDVEAVVRACQIAADWRATFHTDFVIDLICYRRFGHNEMDQPALTQPTMYQNIQLQTPMLERYSLQLLEEKSFTQQEVETSLNAAEAEAEYSYNASKRWEPRPFHQDASWQHLQSPEQLAEKEATELSTGVDEETLRTIFNVTATPPKDFKLHRNLERVLEARKSVFREDAVDWSMAEALAFGSLCKEGFDVRLTGQDVERGTFSQRHAAIHDQVTNKRWKALESVSPAQGNFCVSNSPLSEFGALGFEYGYTLAEPNALVMWEAQFGDFANTAQVIIDNFIASAEYKWMDRSGLVLSLPHGFDGQGAEHSSARLERFLMLCNEEARSWPSNLERQHQDCNMQITYPTTPANYFHLLRRQLKRSYRKPLVNFFSKSLLRHGLTRSELSELTGEVGFQPVLSDPGHGTGEIDGTEGINRVIFCSGQLYASLIQHRATLGLRNAAITRIEEIHPFPYAEVERNLAMYPTVATVVWAQEEHYNGGAWHFVRDRLETVLRRRTSDNKQIVYAGRQTSPTAATGSKLLHKDEQARLLQDAFTLEH